MRPSSFLFGTLFERNRVEGGDENVLFFAQPEELLEL